MVALHRDQPLSDCCARTLIQHLAFDPELQDRVWRSMRSSRRYPGLRCSGFGKGTGCDLDKLLDMFGFDPVAQTVLWQRSKGPPRKDPQRAPVVNDVSLSHKNLLLPGREHKAYMPCASFLRSHPDVNRPRMVTELAEALQYLHANRVIHGSIRPEAIFVDEDGVPLLAYTPLMVGQFVVLMDAYTAPELHQTDGAAMPTSASDIYSLGGVIHWICMGEHPPLTPLTVASSTNSARPLQHPVQPSNMYFTQQQRTSGSNPQNESPQHDPSIQSLIERSRSQNPTLRPNLLSIVLQLQQAVARYFLFRSKLPLPAPASLSASLSLYMPRTPVKTPSPVLLPTNDIRPITASGKPSPSSPAEPSHPFYPSPPHAPLTENRFARQTAHKTHAASSPLDVLSEVASQVHRPPMLSSLTPLRNSNASNSRPGGGSSWNENLTLPPLRQHLEEASPAPTPTLTPSTAGTSHWTTSPVASSGFEYYRHGPSSANGQSDFHYGPPQAQGAAGRLFVNQTLHRNRTV